MNYQDREIIKVCDDLMELIPQVQKRRLQMSNLGGSCEAPLRQSQVSEEQGRIGDLMTTLSEGISKLEQRIEVCLRGKTPPPPEKSEKCKTESPKVELANRLSIHGEDLQRQIYRIRDITERCEL